MEATTKNVRLTPAECELLNLIHAGAARTNREMAARLFISTKTVEARLAGLYQKYGVHCLAHLILKTITDVAVHDDVINMRVGDYRFISGKRFRVTAYGADSRGCPCIILESENESLTFPLVVSIPG